MQTDSLRAFFFAAVCRGLCLSGVLLTGVTATSAEPSVQVDTLWAEDWEGDFTDNWFVDAGTWEVGLPTSGPGSAYEGENVGATVLAGNYGEPVDTRLIRFTSFVVPAASENPRLRFWHWYRFSSADNGEVQVSTDGGTTWNAVSPTYTATGSGVWIYPWIDLAAFEGETVQIAFDFHSQQSGPFGNVSTGWYIDDITVVTGPVVFNSPEGFESGVGDWYAESGTWEIGPPTSGPGSAHTGEWVAATVLGGNYAEPVDSRLISSPFEVAPASENPALEFWHWFRFSSADTGGVQISADGGDSWDEMAAFSGIGSGAWTFFRVPLSSYAGETVQIAFDFHSQQSGPFGNVSTGWYIDDVEVDRRIPVSVDPEDFATSFVLQGAYPNPFQSATAIHLGLAEAADVTLRVFDVLGREVAPSTTRALAAGDHYLPWEATNLAGGVYVYQVKARMAGRTESGSGLLTLLE